MIKIYSTGGRKEGMITLDKRDVEILRDVLEAHLEYLYDVLKDCVVDDDTCKQYEDEQVRIGRVLNLIDKEE